MEPFTTIATSIISSIASEGIKSSGKALFSFTKSKNETEKRMEDYLRRVSNETLYCTSYRLSPQTLDEVYVIPRIINKALSTTFLSPTDYSYVAQIEQSKIPESGQLETIKTKQTIKSREMSTVIETPVALLNLEFIDVFSLVNSDDSLVVLGDAGDGKSSFLAFLLWSRLKTKRPRFPIFLNSRALRGKDLLSCIDDVLNGVGFLNSEAYLADAAQNTSIYLDGLT